ncbi:MAG: hypothetical protein LBT55_02950 [Clostridiaceae bacterium]|jgi:hypothetical protein|nr:hypothetical protein [Clostridiaceae bacterium]
MKKFLSIVLVAATAVMIAVFASGCSLLGNLGKAEKKVFEKAGIKLTLTDEFYEKDILTYTIYLESTDKAVIALKEEPNAMFPISTELRAYTESVLSVNMLTTPILTSSTEEGVLLFEYFIYEKIVSGKDFTYLAITKKSETAFYLIQFTCETKNFADFKGQFLDWAKLVEVA